MSQSLPRFKANLEYVLQHDTDLAAFATGSLGGAWVTVDGNVTLGKVLPKQLPAMGFEVGDGTNQLEVIGQHAQNPNADIPVFIVFHDDDRESAFAKRLQIPGLFIRALMRKPTLDIGDSNGDAVDGCWVADWTSNRGNPAQHPRHWMLLTVRGIYHEEV